MTDPLTNSADLVAGAGLAALGTWALHRPEAQLQWRELRVPGELRVEQVTALMAHVASGSGPVVLIVDARLQAIRFLVGAGKSVLAGLTAALSGIASDIRLDERGVDLPPEPALGARAWWTDRWPLLRTDAPEMAVAGLLGSLSSVRADEHVRLIIRLSPARRRPRPPEEPDRLLRSKLAGPLIRAEVLLSVAAQPTIRARQLAQAVIAALRTLDGSRGRLRVRRLRVAATRRALERTMGSRQWWGLTTSTLLSPAELVGVVGLPVGSPKVAGVSYGTAPVLMPAPRIPAGGPGRSFGVSDWQGATRRRLVQAPAAISCHTLLVGPSGVGKSTLLTNLALADVEQGKGLVFMDLKGDAATSLMARIRPDRIDDVVVLEPTNGLPVPGLRVFGNEAPELAADMLLGTFKGLFKDSFGVLSDHYLRLGFATLAHDPNASLADLPILYRSAGFRRRTLRRISDPLLLGEWQAYESLSPAQQVEQLSSPLRKIGALVGRPTVRAVVAQPASRFDLRRALEQRKIVVVSLPPGRLGASATLLSALVMWELFSAVLSRQEIPEDRRAPFGFYLDEPKVLTSVPVPLAEAFELFRGMNVGVTLAAQSIAQLPKDVRRAALSNASTLAVFRQHAEADAALLARELRAVSAEQLQHLSVHQLCLRLALSAGDIAPPATTITSPLPAACVDPDAVRRASAARYGTSLEDVDAALAVRHGLQPPAARSGDAPDGDAVTNGASFGHRRSS